MSLCTSDRVFIPLSIRFISIVLPLLTIACAAEDTQKSPSASAASATGESAPYTVECGQVDDDGASFCYVDKDTYIGWRTYHGFCHVCHAQDAVGSTFAPSLVERMGEPDMTLELFVDRLDNGFTGQLGVMPPWKDNPNVSKRYVEIYTYLMARADGALPPGRPKRRPKTE